MAAQRLPGGSERLPVKPATVTVNGNRVRRYDAQWRGLNLSLAIVREQASILVALVGAEAPLDHHLDVPWCHPDDQPDGWSDGMRYRVRPRKRGLRFVREDGQWWLVMP